MKHKYASTLNRHQLLIVVDTSIPPYEPICLLVQLSQTTSPGFVLKEKMREITTLTKLLGKMPCFLDSPLLYRQYIPVSVHTPSSCEGALLVI